MNMYQCVLMTGAYSLNEYVSVCTNDRGLLSPVVGPVMLTAYQQFPSVYDIQLIDSQVAGDPPLLLVLGPPSQMKQPLLSPLVTHY